MILFARNSNNRLSKWWWNIDKVILLCILLLLIFSIILVSTASPFVAVRIGLEPLYFIKNQIIYICASIMLILIISSISLERNIKIAFITFAVAVLLMIFMVFFVGEIKGAKRWINIGFSLQPSEFAKVTFPIVLSYIYYFLYKKNFDVLRIYFLLFLIYIILALCLLLQPDLGMTILITMIFGALLILTGISLLWILSLCFLSGLGLLFAYFLFPHANYRINHFLFEQNSYQVTKALNAIISGKIFGKGAGQGSLKKYLPDSHTDFVFTVGAEEFGLIFNCFLMIVYIVLIYRSYNVLLKQRSMFKILALGTTIVLISLQSIIHIASNINLIPTKGMTLPLISYGGSSMVSMALLMGFLLSLTKKDINNIELKE